MDLISGMTSGMTYKFCCYQIKRNDSILLLNKLCQT